MKKNSSFFKCFACSLRRPVAVRAAVKTVSFSFGLGLEIVAQCLLFVLGGWSSVANTLSLLLYNLAVYQDTQDRVIAELNTVLGADVCIFALYNFAHHFFYVHLKCLRVEDLA